MEKTIPDEVRKQIESEAFNEFRGFAIDRGFGLADGGRWENDSGDELELTYKDLIDFYIAGRLRASKALSDAKAGYKAMDELQQEASKELLETSKKLSDANKEIERLRQSHPEQGEQGEVYKWVKASEAYPSQTKKQCFRTDNNGEWHYWTGYYFKEDFYQREYPKDTLRIKPNEIEWLCKLSSPPPEGQDEVKRLKDLIEKLYKGSMKFAAGLWDDIDIATEWNLFKTENNL